EYLQRGAQLDRNRQYTIEPDEIQDFRDLPYKDASFRLIVWDPPHIKRSNGMQRLNGIMVRKYGALHAETWQSDLKEGFTELWRVLQRGGT
ncbi:MAG: SAM-dependent methyltransferase, partial [Candidatus Nanohaloarchaea archaeon]